MNNDSAAPGELPSKFTMTSITWANSINIMNNDSAAPGELPSKLPWAQSHELTL